MTRGRSKTRQQRRPKQAPSEEQKPQEQERKQEGKSAEEDRPGGWLWYPSGEHEPAPPCEGPKLLPFRPFGRAADIVWLRQVAVTDHSELWKVEIEGQVYALKLFGLPACPYTSIALTPAALNEWIDHMDYFNAEARAYGRLREAGREDLAVRCHGYLMLTPDQEAGMREFSNRRLPYMPERGSGSVGADFPIRGIVKDWVAEGTPAFEPRMARAMLEDLKAISALGIMNRDVRARNYLGGKLVDFSIAWTVPHREVDKLRRDAVNVSGDAKTADWSARELDLERCADLAYLDRIFSDWNEQLGRPGRAAGPMIWLRTYTNYDLLRRLRRRQERRLRSPCRGPDATAYDWRGEQQQRRRHDGGGGGGGGNTSTTPGGEGPRHRWGVGAAAVRRVNKSDRRRRASGQGNQK